MGATNFSPAVLAICLDVQSLSYNSRLVWQDLPREELPRSLARRLTWRADAAPEKFRFRSPPRSGAMPRKLADTQFDIMEADCAADALELLRMLRFDLVLIGADAVDATVPSLLRQIQTVSPGTRCIVVSSAIDERGERSIREAGVLAILDAPLPFTQLRDVVSQLAVSR